MSKNYLSKQKIPFTMVCNQIIFDPQVSSKAKFYYVYLSSKPEGWEFHTNAIMAEIKEGKDAFYSGLQELEEFGYLQRVQKRLDGKFSATEYTLLLPNDKLPYTENPDTENPYTENPDNNNIYSNKKDLNKKDCIATASSFLKNVEHTGRKVEFLNYNDLSLITEEQFTQAWREITFLEPKNGIKRSFDNFKIFYNRLSKEKKIFFKDWRGYLKEKWIPQEMGLEYKPNIICPEVLLEFLPDKEQFKLKLLEGNETLSSRLPEDLIKTFNPVGLENKSVLVLEGEQGAISICNEYYQNRFLKLVRKVFQNFYNKRITDYRLCAV